MTHSLDKRRARAAFRRRLGFTMIEIMTSVTLSLMLMYAVARIFSRVGGTMNETTSIMQATNSLRNAKNRLTADLEGITVDPVPPRNSRLGDGYLCYVEGMGAPMHRLYNGGYDSFPSKPFSTACIALDSERYQHYKGRSGSDYTDWVDTTVGDVDDSLSFPARAPVDRQFRGRYIRPIYDETGAITGGVPDTFESEVAEIVWFVRGTTLYRRVLPILSNERLQESLYALRLAGNQGTINWDKDTVYVSEPLNVPNPNPDPLCDYGCGFFRFYDVSVHLDEYGRLVANDTSDLTNRANRYGYWNPFGVNGQKSSSPLSIHGKYDFISGKYDGDAWYWLRMPTLQECVQESFRAGAPFGRGSYAYFAYPTDTDETAVWKGPAQTLNFQQNDSEGSPLSAGNHSGADLPAVPAKVTDTDPNPEPFVDFWNNPNFWDEVDPETGDIRTAVSDNVFNQDVILTNVLSFDVKAWDPDVNDYIDLGYDYDRRDGVGNLVFANPMNAANDLCSGGRYFTRNSPLVPYPLPCVYDTWTEQYQRDLYASDYENGTAFSNGSIADVSLDGKITSAQLKDYPPPYDVPLKSLQIEIRVFDPRSKQIRNATFIVDLTK